jgi:hypothetical protein
MNPVTALFNAVRRPAPEPPVTVQPAAASADPLCVQRALGRVEETRMPVSLSPEARAELRIGNANPKDKWDLKNNAHYLGTLPNLPKAMGLILREVDGPIATEEEKSTLQSLQDVWDRNRFLILCLTTTNVIKFFKGQRKAITDKVADGSAAAMLQILEGDYWEREELLTETHRMRSAVKQQQRVQSDKAKPIALTICERVEAAAKRLAGRMEEFEMSSAFEFGVTFVPSPQLQAVAGLIWAPRKYIDGAIVASPAKLVENFGIELKQAPRNPDEAQIAEFLANLKKEAGKA